MECLSPAEITAKSEEIGLKKVSGKFWNTVVAGILAGMYIAFGAVFSLTSVAGLAGHVPFGIIKVISGLSFSLGLILVVLAGAELFTGNILLVNALLKKTISIWQLLKNWTIIWFANFVGALIVVGLVYVAGWYLNGGIGELAFGVGLHKLEYGFIQAIALGILCNILVCLGVWLARSGKSVADKVLGVVFPITAFVAGGFEHSVANMFYLPFAYLLKITGISLVGIDTSHLTLSNIFVNNLLPVTIGNIIGGAVFVAGLYRFLYGKKNI